MILEIWREIRLSLRMLWNSPGFALSAILIMAIGIGANTATFTVVDKLVFERLPYPGLDRILLLAEKSAKSGIGEDEVSPADYYDWSAQATSFDRLLAYRWLSANLAGEGTPERILALAATPSLFESLEVPPMLGRAFSGEESVPGKNRVAVLSYGLWQQRFAGDKDILNKTMKVDGVNHTIVGVMPPAFDFPAGSQLWLPLALTPQEKNVRNVRYLHCAGKLKPGVSPEQARSELQSIAQRLAVEHPDTNAGIGVKLGPAREQLSGGELTSQLSLLTLGAVVFVLLIACANVANLQLTRVSGRRKEMALRLALGGGKLRAARLLLIESTIVAILGAGLGLLVAGWCIDLMRTHMPIEMSHFLSGWQTLQLNKRAFVITAVFAVAAGILSGIAPALHVVKTDLNEVLKQTGRGGAKANRRVQRVLVIAEVAVALVLLIGAGLMVKGVLHLFEVNTSLHPENIVTMRVTLPVSAYPKPSLISAFDQKVLDRLSAMQGVDSVALVSNIPFGLGGPSGHVIPQGQVIPLNERVRGLLESISAGYFQTLRIPIKGGREFDRHDTEAGQPVAIVSEAMAKRLWPGKNPIGQHLAVGDAAEPLWLTVVGVAGDIKQYWFDPEPRATVYRPYTQAPVRTADFALRVSGDVSAVIAQSRLAVSQIDSDQPVYNLMTMGQMISNSLRGLEYVAVMMGVFGAIALLLTALGLFGVLAYTVTQQTHEIGIRLALGAPPSSVQGRIITEGLTLVGIGFVIGLVSAVALVRVASSLIFGVSPLDPWTFIGIAGLLAVVGLIACYVPSSRAMKVNPAITLRGE